MDFTAVLQMINTVGFPIVAFLVAVYALKYAYDKSNEQSDKALEKIGTLADAVNNNTVVLTRLVEKLDLDETEEAK